MNDLELGERLVEYGVGLAWTVVWARRYCGYPDDAQERLYDYASAFKHLNHRAREFAANAPSAPEPADHTVAEKF